jgi:hypothetical protein
VNIRHFHLQELTKYENELQDPKFLQLNSSALMSEEFGLGAANTCDDHHDHEETEKLKLHIEELEEQVC